MSFRTNSFQQMSITDSFLGLTDSEELFKVCGSDFIDVTEYELFTRCLSE